jgi:hypothetical protein
MQPAYGDVPRRGIKPMEGNEVHAAGNGRVHYGFVGGGKPSTGRRVSMLYTSITRCATRSVFRVSRSAFRIPGNGETGRWRAGSEERGTRSDEPCDPRWTRKEGTDVGWRLRADLHHGGDPGACYPGVACRSPVYLYSGIRQRNPSSTATAVDRERREVPCLHASAHPGRSCGPLDHLVGCGPVRVLVAFGQGQPCVHRNLASFRLWSDSSKEQNQDRVRR